MSSARSKSAAQQNTGASAASQPNEARVLVIPGRPQVVVLPNTNPYENVPALIVSIGAFALSFYTLRRNLVQKRDEHRAKFFHDVAVAKCLDPLLSFFDELQRFAETTGTELAKSNGQAGHDEAVRTAMRTVRDKKRTAAIKVLGVVSPFSENLERDVQNNLDQAADDANEWLEMHASGSVPDQQIGRALAKHQRHSLDLLREHEFQLGWPTKPSIFDRIFRRR